MGLLTAEIPSLKLLLLNLFGEIDTNGYLEDSINEKSSDYNLISLIKVYFPNLILFGDFH